jgi:hypothetical protein
MASLRGIYRFRTGGIWVRRELLGTSYIVERDGKRIEVAFPSHEDDFRTWGLLEGEFYWALGAPSTGTVDDPDQAVTVYVVQATVEFDAELDTAAFRDAPSDDVRYKDAASHGINLIEEGRAAAESVVRELLSWIRVRPAQSGLGLTTEPIEREGVQELIDVESGERLPVGGISHIDATLQALESALRPEDVAGVWEQIDARAPPPLPETLLADAAHFAWGDAPDPIRAILTAAIACEIKVKTNLRERIDPPRAELLDFILENPREVTLTAADGLFDKLMELVQGRSLRKADRDLFNEVKELFRTRNGIAHRGELPNLAAARRLTAAARRAFVWLDSA